MEKLLTIDEVAETLRVRKSTIYSLVHRGIIPHRKITPKILRFLESEIQEWVDRKVSSTSPPGTKGRRRGTIKVSGKARSTGLEAIIDKAIGEVLNG